MNINIYMCVHTYIGKKVTGSTFFWGFGFCTIEDNSASKRYTACIKLYQERNQ